MSNIRENVTRSYLEENIRDQVVDLTDKLEHLVVGKMLEGKLALSSVAGIGFPQDSMAIARNNLTTLEGGPDVFLHSLIGRLLTNLGLHLTQPDQDLLVGEAVEGTSKTIEGSGVGEERIGEGGANKFASVCRNIATLVITAKELAILMLRQLWLQYLWMVM